MQDTEKLIKKQLRQARAQANLKVLDAIKRPQSPTRKIQDTEQDDEELQIVERLKKDLKIEVIELD